MVISQAQMISDRVKRHPWLWLFILYTCILLINGPDFIDWQDFLLISKDPLHLLATPARQFLYYSPINFLLAALLRLDSMTGFFLIHGIEIVLMLACVAISIQKKFETTEQQSRFISLLALAPLWLVSMKWLGKSDPVLIGALFLAWAFPGRWRLLLTMLIVASHREIGTLMCISLFFLESRKDYALLIGMLAGLGLHLIYDFGILEHPPVSRADLVGAGDASSHLMVFLRIPTLCILTSFSWYWIVLILNRPTLKEVLVLAGAFAVAITCEDFTRDFILLALPALLFHLEHVTRRPQPPSIGKLVPLSVLQLQIAAMGQIYKPGNMLLAWLISGF